MWAIASPTGWPSRTLEPGRRIGERVPASARRPPLVQLDVAAAVQRRAQGGDEGELVRGVGGGPEGEEEMADLRGDVHDRGVLGAIRNRRARRAPPRASAARCGPGAARRCRRRGTGATPRRRRRPAIPRSSAVATALATSAASRSRNTCAVTSPPESSWASTPSTVTVPWSRRPSRQVWSGTKAGCTSGWGEITSENTPLTQSMTAALDRKLAESTIRSAPRTSPARR